MKYVIFLFMFLLVSCVHTKKTIIDNGNKKDICYKIVKIKEPCYIIYAKRNDSIFKIASAESNDENKHIYEKIKVRKKCKLNLLKICPPDTLLGVPFMPNLGIKGMTVENGETVFLEKSSHNTLYKASNLDGLYIFDE